MFFNSLHEESAPSSLEISRLSTFSCPISKNKLFNACGRAHRPAKQQGLEGPENHPGPRHPEKTKNPKKPNTRNLKTTPQTKKKKKSRRSNEIKIPKPISAPKGLIKVTHLGESRTMINPRQALEAAPFGVPSAQRSGNEGHLQREVIVGYAGWESGVDEINIFLVRVVAWLVGLYSIASCHTVTL